MTFVPIDEVPRPPNNNTNVRAAIEEALKRGVAYKVSLAEVKAASLRAIVHQLANARNLKGHVRVKDGTAFAWFTPKEK